MHSILLLAFYLSQYKWDRATKPEKNFVSLYIPVLFGLSTPYRSIEVNERGETNIDERNNIVEIHKSTIWDTSGRFGFVDIGEHTMKTSLMFEVFLFFLLVTICQQSDDEVDVLWH